MPESSLESSEVHQRMARSSRQNLDQLQNKLGIFIVNLEPVTLRGIKSDGMTLAAVNDDESVIAILEPNKDIELGSKIR